MLPKNCHKKLEKIDLTNKNILPSLLKNFTLIKSEKEEKLRYRNAAEMLRYEADGEDLLIKLELRSFILVSFGSLAKVEFMKEDILQRFFDAFEKLPYLVVWQTNSERDKLFSIIPKAKVPKNVYLLKWAPIQILLGL